MVGENSVTNLFGDVVALPKDGPGRPAHLWSRENSNRVLLAFARGLSLKDAADSIGVSVPTLRKVYFSECDERRRARLRLEMTQLARLNAMAEAGSVPAEKELAKMLDRLRQHDMVRQQAPAPTKAVAQPRPGKKELAEQAARQVTDMYGPRPGPHELN